MNNTLKEVLSQLGVKFPRKGKIVVDEHAKTILGWSGISEVQMINTFRHGDEETQGKFIRVEGAYKITIVVRPKKFMDDQYELISCWLGKNYKK
jgi:hypothetical protein